MQDRLIEESFSKYKEYLTAVIKAVCRDISDADVDDILSDVYLKLCRTSQMYDEDKASVKTYLSYIARNAAIDFAENQKLLMRILMNMWSCGRMRIWMSTFYRRKGQSLSMRH